MAPRFSMDWSLPQELGLPTFVRLTDHAGDHREWRGVGDDEAEALLALSHAMSGDAPPEAFAYVASAYVQRTGRPLPPGLDLQP